MGCGEICNEKKARGVAGVMEYVTVEELGFGRVLGIYAACWWSVVLEFAHTGYSQNVTVII